MSMPQGPTETSVRLRAKWSLGNVQDRYINPTPENDQYLGRTLSGLSYTSIEFGLLTPHFPNNFDAMPYIEAHAPGWHTFYAEYLLKFGPVVKMMVTNLAHHHDFLNDNLPVMHPFRF